MFALTTYRRPATTLPELVDSFLSDTFADWPLHAETETFSPRVDVVEEKDAYRLHADVPGLAKEDLKVAVENGVLTISGERKSERKEKGKDGYRYYECSHGTFSRSFNLPENVDGAAVKAVYANGVLDLTLPKREEARPKAIDVKVE